MSEKVKQIEWYLDELDCANCANKVETGIAKIEGILESNVNFMTKTLRIEIEEDQEADSFAESETKTQCTRAGHPSDSEKKRRTNRSRWPADSCGTIG